MSNFLFAAIHGKDGKILSCALYQWSADTDSCFTTAYQIAEAWEYHTTNDERAVAKGNKPVNGVDAYDVASKLLESTGAKFSNDPKYCSSLDGIIFHPSQAEKCMKCACGELHVDIVNETFRSDCFITRTEDEYELERSYQAPSYNELPYDEHNLLAEAPLTVSDASVLADIVGICPDGVRLKDGDVALWIL